METQIPQSHTTDHYVSVVLLLFLGILISATNLFSDRKGQHFSVLALSFLQGDLSLPLHSLNLDDVVYFDGHAYWPLGPLPAVLLMPAVALARALGTNIFIGAFLQIPFVFLIMFLVYRLAKQFAFSASDARYLTFAFVGASAFLDISLFPLSYYFSHVATVCFLLVALHEFFGKRRYWIIGLAMGLVAMTRLTAGFGIIFFLLSILDEPGPWRERLRAFGELITPVLVSVILLLLYNFFRFQNPFESGYTHANLGYAALTMARTYGLFSLTHLPGNLYYFFLGHPTAIFRDGLSHVLKSPYIIADPWGMSIFITSPYYLLLFQSRPSTKREYFLWITVVAIAIPIFLYYGIGYLQVGYRYALDFLPFLFLLFLTHLRRTSDTISFRLKVLFVVTFLANLYFTFTLQGIPIP